MVEYNQSKKFVDNKNASDNTPANLAFAQQCVDKKLLPPLTAILQAPMADQTDFSRSYVPAIENTMATSTQLLPITQSADVKDLCKLAIENTTIFTTKIAMIDGSNNDIDEVLKTRFKNLRKPQFRSISLTQLVAISDNRTTSLSFSSSDIDSIIAVGKRWSRWWQIEANGLKYRQTEGMKATKDVQVIGPNHFSKHEPNIRKPVEFDGNRQKLFKVCWRRRI